MDLKVSSVVNDARTMSFITPEGITVATPIFVVLVLRFDPSDFTTSEHSHEDAVDPTGPLYWLREDVSDVPWTICHKQLLWNGQDSHSPSRKHTMQGPAWVDGSGGQELPSIEG